MRRLYFCLAISAVIAGRLVGQSTPQADLTELSVEQLMDVRVQTAALKQQSLRAAPADVSVITAADIQRYGYRTLGEALSSVRGFYVTQDGGFQFAGVRGFSLLGDYNTRFLVMIDGHSMTDNIYSAMYMFGQDFSLDMDLVEQIEVVRGPSSALYGSNGVFASVNIITKSGQSSAVGATLEVGPFGESKARVSKTFRFGRDGMGVISGSAFKTSGRTANLSTSDDPNTVLSIPGIGKEDGYHSFARLNWNQWSIAALFGQRRTTVPTGFYGADVGDPGTRSLEGRNFVEVAWRRPFGLDSALKWRAWYDQFRYDGIYNFLQSDNYQSVDGAVGDFVGNQLVYQKENTRLGSITAGAETNVDVRNLQYIYDFTPGPTGKQLTNSVQHRHPNLGYGFFIQDEWRPSASWTFYLGGRFDDSRLNMAMFSPRAAVVYTRGNSAYKLTYGRGFRNPSTFERYWEPNPLLEAERIQTVELTREQRIARSLNLITSVFHYRLTGLIQGVPVTEERLQYRNSSKASASGFETELNGRLFDKVDGTASYTYHRVRAADGQTRLENSPAHIGLLRASVPVVREFLHVAGVMRYIAPRLTAVQSSVPSATLLDLTATVRQRNSPLDVQFGMRNVLDKQYSDPLSPEHRTALLPRAGRTAYLKLTWRTE